jgi:SAM-dependent methyltransferase
MIAVAWARQPAIDWVQGDALDMPFPDRAFDIVASQFVLMLLEDRVAALREMRRVLKPEGVLHVALFEGLAVNSGYDRIARAYEREAGADVADALRFPFSLGDLGELRALFDEAGLPAPECETLTVTARFENAMALTLADVRGWFPFAGLSLNEAEIDGVAARLDADFGALGGAVAFEVHAHLLTVD